MHASASGLREAPTAGAGQTLLLPTAEYLGCLQFKRVGLFVCNYHVAILIYNQNVYEQVKQLEEVKGRKEVVDAVRQQKQRFLDEVHGELAAIKQAAEPVQAKLQVRLRFLFCCFAIPFTKQLQCLVN